MWDEGRVGVKRPRVSDRGYSMVADRFGEVLNHNGPVRSNRPVQTSQGYLVPRWIKNSILHEISSISVSRQDLAACLNTAHVYLLIDTVSIEQTKQ